MKNTCMTTHSETQAAHNTHREPRLFVGCGRSAALRHLRPSLHALEALPVQTIWVYKVQSTDIHRPKSNTYVLKCVMVCYVMLMMSYLTVVCDLYIYAIYKGHATQTRTSIHTYILYKMARARPHPRSTRTNWTKKHRPPR